MALYVTVNQTVAIAYFEYSFIKKHMGKYLVVQIFSHIFVLTISQKQKK